MSPRLELRPNAGQRADIPAFFLYGEPLRAPDLLAFHIETIAARSRLHEWKIRAHRHRDLHQLLLLWQGAVAAQLDGMRRQLHAPALVIVPPLTVHGFEFKPATDGVVVSFAPALAREMLRDADGVQAVLNRPYAARIPRSQLATTDLQQLASMLLREFAHAATARDSALHGLLATLLANVARVSRTIAAVPNADRHERELVADFRAAIERSYRARISVSAYARAIGSSGGALRRACIKVLGQSPTQLLRGRRLTESQRQLRYTGMTIAQIAYGLGFEDPAYFSRVFAKATGSSPRNYRRRAGSS
jgi:AraC family transcriptional activator of pobA